jgi:hypothetical protein
MTLAAAGAIWCRHLPDGSIQWLLVNPWMWFIGQCALHCTTTPILRLKLPAMEVHLFIVAASFVLLFDES